MVSEIKGLRRRSQGDRHIKILYSKKKHISQGRGYIGVLIERNYFRQEGIYEKDQ
jgi:hypothetical protein